MGVGLGVRVFVAVGISVFVIVGVGVGINNCPRRQADIKMSDIRNVMGARSFSFM